MAFASTTSSGKNVAAGRRWEGVFGVLRRRPLLLAVVILVCFCVLGLVGYLLGLQLWAEHRWRLAQRALHDCSWREARGHLESCLQVWPKSAEAHFQLARCCRREGDLDAAQKHLKQAADLGWLTEAVDLEHLLSVAQAGGVAGVEKVLQSYLKNGHPEGPLILEAMVEGYLRFNAVQEAYQYADRWVTHYPDDWRAYLQRGTVLQRFAVTLSPLRQAVLDYERAAELNPESPEVHLRLAQILEFSGRYTDAQPHFRFVRDVQPENRDAFAGMVRCLFSAGELRQATQLLDDYLQREPADADLCYLKGRLCLDMDAPVEAVRWLLQAMNDLGRRNPEYLHLVATACRRAGRAADADQYEKLASQIEEDLRRVRDIIMKIADAPAGVRSVALRLEAAELLARRGQEDEAERWLLNALQLNPSHEPTRRALTKLSHKTGNQQLKDFVRGLPLIER